MYTQYDELLKRFDWNEARRIVGNRTLEILALWRGDKEDEPDAMEDILREVIVISDNEDSASPPAPGQAKAMVRDVTSSDPKNSFDANATVGSGRSQYLAQRPAGEEQNALPPDNHMWSARPVQRRYQAWEQARERYRAFGPDNTRYESVYLPSNSKTRLTVSSSLGQGSTNPFISRRILQQDSNVAVPEAYSPRNGLSHLQDPNKGTLQSYTKNQEVRYCCLGRAGGSVRAKLAASFTEFH